MGARPRASWTSDSLLTASPKWAIALAQMQRQGQAAHQEGQAMLFRDTAGDSDVVMRPPASSTETSTSVGMPPLDSTQAANYRLVAIAHSHPWHGRIPAGVSREFPQGGYADGDPSPDDVAIAQHAGVPSYVTNADRVYRIDPSTGLTEDWHLPAIMQMLGLQSQ